MLIGGTRRKANCLEKSIRTVYNWIDEIDKERDKYSTGQNNG